MSTYRQTFTLPRDYEQFPESLKLIDDLKATEGWTGSGNEGICTVVSNHIFTRVWNELARQAGSYIEPMPPLGCFPVANLDGIFATTKLSSLGLTLEQFKAILVSSGTMKERGEHLFCPMFYIFNGNLIKEFRSYHEHNNDRVLLRTNAQRYQRDSKKRWAKHGVPEVYMTVVDGKPITDTERNRIDVLVRTVDYLFKRPARPDSCFGVGLVQSACRFARTFTPTYAQEIMHYLAAKRSTFTLPRTAEHFFGHAETALAEVLPKGEQPEYQEGGPDAEVSDSDNNGG